MKHLLHRFLVVLTAFSLVAAVWAGNIPQYKYTRGTTNYTEFTDGTSITSKWEQSTVIFADGTETNDAYTGQGFPIEFDFRFAGKTFNQFAVGNNGVIYFGKDKVTFNGISTLAFHGVQAGSVGGKPNSDYYNTFYGGLTPIVWGIKTGKISYKTTGTEGNRICTVQFSKMILNENYTEKGQYSLQIRMYEGTNIFETAFIQKKDEGCVGKLNGFFAGIRGWDDDDTILLKGDQLDGENVVVAPVKEGNMLDPQSYIHWDPERYDIEIKAVYTFTPDSNPVPPANAPAGLTLTENNGNLNVTCDKAEGADATVVLYSTSPITDAELPADGETFDINTKFGNSTVMYYGDGNHISLTIKNIIPETAYHVKALSANGLPAFNRSNTATQEYKTTQAPPVTFTATPVSTHAFRLNWETPYTVIIAMGDTCSGVSGGSYAGVFDQPTIDANVGDVMPAGGKIIYKGDDKEYILENCEANQIGYFRAWTINENIISSTGKDTYGILLPSLPYQPQVEKYPNGIIPSGWTSANEGLTPTRREYDKLAALKGTSVEGTSTDLVSPALPLDCPSRLTFEYSLETIVPVKDKEDPKGYKPGIFGDGHGLIVSAGAKGTENVYQTINTYDGTMTVAEIVDDENRYATGSSTFKQVKVDLPAMTADSHIAFQFSAETFSHLYLRNISLEATGVNIGNARQEENAKTVVYGGEGILHIQPACDEVVYIYNVCGCKVASVTVKSGVATSLPMQAGIYLTNGQKIIVK